MASYQITLIVEKDGAAVSDLCITRRIVVDESQSFDYEKTDDGNGTTFTTVPAGEIGTLQMVIMRPSEQVTVRLDGQTDAGILVNARGLLVLVDATVDAGASTNMTVNNNSGAVAQLKGMVGGT